MIYVLAHGGINQRKKTITESYANMVLRGLCRLTQGS